MSLIQTWTPSSFIYDLQCHLDWASRAQIHLEPIHGAIYVFICKCGSKMTHTRNWRKIVKEHGQNSFYCILNGVKDVSCHKIRSY